MLQRANSICAETYGALYWDSTIDVHSVVPHFHSVLLQSAQLYAKNAQLQRRQNNQSLLHGSSVV